MEGEIYTDFARPWCQLILNDPGIEDITAPGRGLPGPGDPRFTNAFFTKTLRSEQAIRAWKSLRKTNTMAGNLSPQFLLMLSLGVGLGGMDKELHGGVVASILGQGMWIAATVTFGPLVTKEMTRRYQCGVNLPEVVLCRSVVIGREGRAVRVRGSLENGEGAVCCEAEGLYVILKKPKDDEVSEKGLDATTRLARL